VNDMGLIPNGARFCSSGVAMGSRAVGKCALRAPPRQLN
jgi:hypothetical protein